MKTKTSTIKKNSICETIKKLLLFLMFTVIIPLTFETTTLFAQTEFNSVNQKQQVYYDSLLNVLGVDSMRGTGYTQYKRWHRYWAPKLSTNYDFDDYQSDLIDYTNNYVAPLSNNTGPNWRFIGPDDIPSLGSTGSGTGQIHYIYRRPQDEESGDILYACSPVGGLFKSTNNGDSWFNLGTDKGLPRSGVSSVVGDNFSYSTLYITTGNGEGFDGEKAWQTAIGVWRTNNDGATWKNIGLQYDSDDSANNKIYHMRKIIDVNHDPSNNAHLIVTTTEGLYSTTNANAQNPEWEELIDGEFYDVVQYGYGETIFASGSNSTGIFMYDLENNLATKIFDIDTVSFPYDTITRPELRRISLQIPKAAGASNYLFAVLSMRDYDHTSIYRYNITNGNWHKFLGAPFANGYARKLGWIIRPGLHGSENDKLHIMGRDVSNLDLFYNGLSNDDSVKFRSVDITHYAKDPHDDFHYLMMDTFNDSVIWAGTDGGVYKGTFVNDSLIDWEPKSKGLGVTTVEFLDAKDNIVTSGQFDCGSNVYTTNDEINWDILHRLGGDGFQNIIDNEDLYYLSAQEGRVTAIIEGYPNQVYMGKYFPWDTNCVQQDSLVWRSIFSTYYTKLGDRLYAAGEKEVLKYPNLHYS